MFKIRSKAIIKVFFLVSILIYFLPHAMAEANKLTNDNTIAQPKPLPSRLWNLRNADIHSVIEEVSRETGKNFLVDPRVTGKVTIISSQPMPPDELYQVFLSMLQVLGYSAIPSGDITKIIPTMNANQLNQSVGNLYHPTEGDEIVVQVIPVKNSSASKLIPILRPLIPETSNISAYESSNTLIVSSTAASIQKIAKIIADVDKSNSSSIEVIPLYQATAGKIVTVLTNLYTNNNDPSAKIAFAADEHTNSILLSGDLQSRLKLRALISQLDSPSPAGNTGNTQVVFLHYLKAKDLAPILTKMLEGGQSAEGETKLPSSSSVSIQAELSTNSIVLTAPPATMATIKRVIDILDGRPSQVLVEAAIVEVNEKLVEQMGILWGQLVRPEGNGNTLAGATSDKGLPVGFAPGLGVIKAGDLRGILTMIANDDSSDILSTPSIMVLDNQQAKIEVGQTLSIETGSYASTNSETPSANPFTTFSRDNIGLHLYVTPQINRGNSVQLEIDQGNETLQNPNNPTTTPVTNNTSLKTTVIVNDKDILVLGGLLTNGMNKSITKIPYLGDIPLIGNLFSLRGKTLDKRNLMIFIKPTIIHNRKINDALADTNYNLIRNQQIEWENKARKELTVPILDSFTPQRTTYFNEQANERILPPKQEKSLLPIPFGAEVNIEIGMTPDAARR